MKKNEITRVSIFYQDCRLNFGTFDTDNLVLNTKDASFITNLTVEQLEKFNKDSTGQEFIDNDSLCEQICQTIFRVFNIEHHKVGLSEEVYRAAGHQSMSVGDYVVFHPRVISLPTPCYICANVGWKVIDYYKFVEEHDRVKREIDKLPINIIEGMAGLQNKDYDTFVKAFQHFANKKCENECPQCGAGGHLITWGAKDYTLDTIFQSATCNECGCHFNEEYSYSGTYIPEQPAKSTD